MKVREWKGRLESPRPAYSLLSLFLSLTSSKKGGVVLELSMNPLLYPSESSRP